VLLRSSGQPLRMAWASARSPDDDEVLAAGDRRVDEVSRQHGVVLGGKRSASREAPATASCSALGGGKQPARNVHASLAR
jgi:hypothetical protein